jgi:nickel transport protein
VAILVALLLAGGAAAHDLWLEPEGEGRLLLRYGHRSGDHGGPESIPYDPAIVRSATCLDAEGRTVSALAEAIPARGPWSFPCAGVAAYVLTSSGSWTKTPYGTRNIPRAEADRPIRSWVSFESAKWLAAWSPGAIEPLTAELEISPLQNPFEMRAGEKLAVRVTFAGRAAAGAIVCYAGKPRGTTAPDGTIRLKLRRAGMQYLQASLTLSSRDPHVDEEVHATSLCFRIGDEP